MSNRFNPSLKKYNRAMESSAFCLQCTFDNDAEMLHLNYKTGVSRKYVITGKTRKTTEFITFKAQFRVNRQEWSLCAARVVIIYRKSGHYVPQEWSLCTADVNGLFVYHLYSRYRL